MTTRTDTRPALLADSDTQPPAPPATGSTFRAVTMPYWSDNAAIMRRFGDLRRELARDGFGTDGAFAGFD